MSTLLIRLGFWLAILFASFMAFAPPPAVPVFRVSDVVLHAVTFSVLVYGLRMAYFPHRLTANSQWLLAPGRWWQAGLWMVAYGAGIELVQAFTPDRQPLIKDLLVDIAGIGVGLLAYRWLGGWSHNLAKRLFG